MDNRLYYMQAFRPSHEVMGRRGVEAINVYSGHIVVEASRTRSANSKLLNYLKGRTGFSDWLVGSRTLLRFNDGGLTIDKRKAVLGSVFPVIE